MQSGGIGQRRIEVLASEIRIRRGCVLRSSLVIRYAGLAGNIYRVCKKSQWVLDSLVYGVDGL